MTVINAAGSRSRTLILAAMIFAVAMTFIDQTIVSIAVPEIQKELGLSRAVLYVMAGIMAVAAVVALLGLRAGVQEEVPASGQEGEALRSPDMARSEDN